ncbi:MAG: hypothetical protein QW727_03430 [Candidatus Pacearchaeota archaeon]
MRDKKFAIALVIIIILAFALLYFTILGPKIQGYFVNQQIKAQENTVRTIMNVVEQQGFVNLVDGEKSVTLVDIKRLQQEQEQTG